MAVHITYHFVPSVVNVMVCPDDSETEGRAIASSSKIRLDASDVAIVHVKEALFITVKNLVSRPPLLLTPA